MSFEKPDPSPDYETLKNRLRDVFDVKEIETLGEDEQRDPIHEDFRLYLEENITRDELPEIDEKIVSHYTAHTNFDISTDPDTATEAWGRSFFLRYESQIISITRTAHRNVLDVTVDYEEL